MKLLTIKQVAGMLQLSQSKLYELVSQGAFPVYRIGGAIRVSEQDLQEYLRDCREVRERRKKKKAVTLRYLSL